MAAHPARWYMVTARPSTAGHPCSCRGSRFAGPPACGLILPSPLVPIPSVHLSRAPMNQTSFHPIPRPGKATESPGWTDSVISLLFSLPSSLTSCHSILTSSALSQLHHYSGASPSIGIPTRRADLLSSSS